MNGSPEIWLPLSEVSRRLGISVRQVYRLMHSQELPYPVKVGRSARMPESDLLAYMERQKQKRQPQWQAVKCDVCVPSSP